MKLTTIAATFFLWTAATSAQKFDMKAHMLESRQVQNHHLEVRGSCVRRTFWKQRIDGATWRGLFLNSLY